jgi:hypothetical protein
MIFRCRNVKLKLLSDKFGPQHWAV